MDLNVIYFDMFILITLTKLLNKIEYNMVWNKIYRDAFNNDIFLEHPLKPSNFKKEDNANYLYNDIKVEKTFAYKAIINFGLNSHNVKDLFFL